MKVVRLLIVCFALIGCSNARKATRETNRLDAELTSNSENSVAKSHPMDHRKHKHYHDLFLLARKSSFSTVYVKPLHGMAFMGGLQSIVGFAIIKFSIVAVIGAILLAIKIFGILKYADYFYKNDYPPPAPPPQFHGHRGPPAAHPPISFDHDSFDNDWPPHPEHYTRSMNHKFPTSVNVTEIVYSIMHADKEDCRNRLVCELEMMTTRSPLFNYFMRHAATRKHSAPSSQSRSEDCSAYYTKCVESSVRRLVRRRRSRVK